MTTSKKPSVLQKRLIRLAAELRSPRRRPQPAYPHQIEALVGWSKEPISPAEYQAGVELWRTAQELYNFADMARQQGQQIPHHQYLNARFLWYVAEFLNGPQLTSALAYEIMAQPLLYFIGVNNYKEVITAILNRVDIPGFNQAVAWSHLTTGRLDLATHWLRNPQLLPLGLPATWPAAFLDVDMPSIISVQQFRHLPVPVLLDIARDIQGDAPRGERLAYILGDAASTFWPGLSPKDLAPFLNSASPRLRLLALKRLNRLPTR